MTFAPFDVASCLIYNLLLCTQFHKICGKASWKSEQQNQFILLECHSAPPFFGNARELEGAFSPTPFLWIYELALIETPINQSHN